jgi:flavorubredoxin
LDFYRLKFIFGRFFALKIPSDNFGRFFKFKKSNDILFSSAKISGRFYYEESVFDHNLKNSLKKYR